MVKVLYAGQPHSDIKGKTYNGQVFNSIELQLLEQERRQYYTTEYSELGFVENIKNQHIAVEIQKFIEDVKKIAKELFTDNELFKKNLIQDIKMSLGEKFDDEMATSIFINILPQIRFKNFDYSWYEDKIRNFYIGILDQRIGYRDNIIFKSNIGINEKIDALEMIKNDVDFIINNNLVTTFEIDGEMVSIPHVNDVLRKQAQKIKEQLEKDIVVVEFIAREDGENFLLAADAYEKRKRLWAFSNSKLQEKAEKDFEYANRVKNNDPYIWGPTYGFGPDKVFDVRSVTMDGCQKVVGDEYIFHSLTFPARYKYYANKINENNPNGGKRR